MPVVTISHTTNAPIERVFKSFYEEYGDIYKYNPNLTYSFLLEETPETSGIGALRQCNLKDGKNWIKEKVIAVDINKRILIDIYEGTVPLKSAKASFEFFSVSDSQTQVKMTMEFIPKMGLLGLFLSPLMKLAFRSSMKQLLVANESYVTKNVHANEPIVV